ncbi:MAG: hypothetical protein KAS07_04795 [Candidatus Pacebacteria bacterium]|nr:hypothetical protein [Candidatus Paceibacterota bacterium]
MYILPNNKQINIDKLKDAFADLNVEKKYYLDTETGEIISSEKDIQKIKAEINKRYFVVPKLPSSLMISWMQEFAEEMVIFDNPKLSKKLIEILEKEKPIENFMKFLSKDKSGWIHGWSQWESDYIFEKIEDWFCALSIDIEDDMSELDDDCPLCRMMKEGVNDLETLQKGFREAKAKQMTDALFKQADDKNATKD